MVELLGTEGAASGIAPTVQGVASLPVQPLIGLSIPESPFSDCTVSPINVRKSGPHPVGPRPVRPGSFFNRKTREVRFAVEIDPQEVESVNLLLFNSPRAHEPVKAVKLLDVAPGTVGAVLKGKGIGPGLVYAYEVITRSHPDQARWVFDPYSVGVIRPHWISVPDRHVAPSRYHLIPPKSVVLNIGPFKELPGIERPQHKFRRIYELNVRDTKNFPDALIPDSQASFRGTQGTLAFLRCPAFIEHLKRFGITTLELMPVQLSDNELGVENVWGYNPISFFALDDRLCHAKDPASQVEEFRSAVRGLRREGIEVIMDFVGGHTHELGKDKPSRPYYAGQIKGPSTSLRVLGDRLYYLMAPDRVYFDLTACQNTINVRSPQGAELVARAMAHWMGTMGLDGLRLDQATILGVRCEGDPREPRFQFDADTLPLRIAAASKRRITVVEPGAPGLWATGRFPEKLLEWIFSHRADEGSPATQFLSGCKYGGLVGRIAAQISGNSDVFAKLNRGVHFTSCHDGYRTADVCRTAHQALLDRGILRWGGEEERERQIAALGRAHIAWAAFVPGTWMITAGEEFFRSYGGESNAYNKPEFLGLPWGKEGTPAAFCTYLQGLARIRTALKVFDRAELFSPGELHWYREDGTQIGSDARRDCRDGHSLSRRLEEAWSRESHFLGALYSSGRLASQPDQAPVYVVRWGGGEGSFKLPKINPHWRFRLCADSWQSSVCSDSLATLRQRPLQCREGHSRLFGSGAEYKLSGPSVLVFQLIRTDEP